MTYADLKPCPLCGGVPWVQLQHGFTEIKCENKGHSVCVNDYSEEGALRRWNDGLIRMKVDVKPCIIIYPQKEGD